ncbi:hypothetical protein [Leuconostoc fallax]|uniref:Uncharacterized protein n=1 Tax=Leuconostoc fallax TaxID=1251 RepID=A0A4R5N8K6_9LACO|nr:hypothetical protein [Leuconostoc fallax]MBU7455496.1 hypothetical protein [Leuconostoc fallax]TDG68256.1 hypothetical protein C5L23_000562 [Leuconostoc fallax]
MKIPISTSYRQLKSITASLSSRLLIAIDGFRSNILNNRDAHKVHQPTIRSITVVPYESSAKAVDTDSFAYAANASIVEGKFDPDEHHHHTSNSNKIKHFIFHPLRAFILTVILVLVIYVVITAAQAFADNKTPITNQNTQTKKAVK